MREFVPEIARNRPILTDVTERGGNHVTSVRQKGEPDGSVSRPEVAVLLDGNRTARARAPPLFDESADRRPHRSPTSAAPPARGAHLPGSQWGPRGGRARDEARPQGSHARPPLARRHTEGRHDERPRHGEWAGIGAFPPPGARG